MSLLASFKFQVIAIRFAALVAIVAALVDVADVAAAVANVAGDIGAVLLSHNHHKISVVVPNNISSLKV